MSIANTLMAIDALMSAGEAYIKIKSKLERAQAQGRDISDEEILAINALNIQKSIELEDLIKQKIEEYSQ